MTITVNFEPKASPGYSPRKAITLHNVAAVRHNGVKGIQACNMFTDDLWTYDHVVSVVIIPDRE